MPFVLLFAFFFHFSLINVNSFCHTEGIEHPEQWKNRGIKNDEIRKPLCAIKYGVSRLCRVCDSHTCVYWAVVSGKFPLSFDRPLCVIFRFRDVFFFAVFGSRTELHYQIWANINCSSVSVFYLLFLEKKNNDMLFDAFALCAYIITLSQRKYVLLLQKYWQKCVNKLSSAVASATALPNRWYAGSELFTCNSIS